MKWEDIAPLSPGFKGLMPTGNLAGAQDIKDKAIEKLEEQQRERAMLEHSIQSDYLALRRLVGNRIADEFVVDLIKIAF